MKIKRKTVEKVRKWVVLFLLVTGVGYSYRLYVEKDWFTISSYSLIGLGEDESQKILPLLKRSSSGVTLFIFPEDKMLSYPHQAIIDAVTEVVPSRRDIIIRPSGWHVLTIEVKEFIPVMKLNDTTGVTREGIVFTTKRTLEGLPILDSASSTTPYKENGFTFKKLSSFDEQYVENLSSFLEKVSSILFPITKIAIDDIGDVTLFSEEDFSKIMVTKEIDFTKAWSTLVSAIDTDPLKEMLSKKKNTLEYIDLRYGNKVFYKFGDKEFQKASSTAIISDHATTTMVFGTSTEEGR